MSLDEHDELSTEPGSRWILETTDRRGRPVRYSRMNYERHAKKHPEMRGVIEAIRQCLEDPDVEIEADNGHEYFYRKGLGPGLFHNLWLFVVVLFTEGSQGSEGIVKTAYFTSKTIRGGRMIWQRSSP
jgi:hypothetical protein